MQKMLCPLACTHANNSMCYIRSSASLCRLPDATYLGSDEPRAVQIIAASKIQQGDELSDQYQGCFNDVVYGAQLANSVMFANYGFVPHNNPADRIFLFSNGKHQDEWLCEQVGLAHVSLKLFLVYSSGQMQSENP